MKIVREDLSTEKENYFLRKNEIGSADKEIVISDDNKLYYVGLQNGEVTSVSTPDGTKEFNISDINSQLKTGATLGSAITGEKITENAVAKLIKYRVRQYLLS